MQQASSPVLQQLRSLQSATPYALHHHNQDGTLYQPPQHLPELQSLHAHEVYHQHQSPYGLSAPPQPQAHVLPVQYEQHGLPSSASFSAYPANYQQATSPRYLNAQPAPLPGPAQSYQHASPPQTIQPPLAQQHAPLPRPPPPVISASQHVAQHVEHVQPQARAQIQALHGEGDDGSNTNHGRFQGLKMIPDPPDLDDWREKLFNVDDMITLTEEQFQTYFPHIDNIYSHRSTQRHKRKRFVSHYWDCRLKGRPPGTKKSTDPDKKKRKRVARERDLCDVKIKITEFFDQREYEEQLGQPPPGSVALNPTSPLVSSFGSGGGTASGQDHQFFGSTHMLPQQQHVGPWDLSASMVQAGMSMPQYGPAPLSAFAPPARKFYTFQRVNGNGGNGKGDGVAGPHKHSLEESDKVKKNSVLRWLAKVDKDDRKKTQGGDASKKTYHKKATGNALTTVKVHSKEDDLKLYGSAFCPFVQRVWISLEYKQILYQYIEVDPYKKPQSLLEVNPRGLVPALRHGPSWSIHESTVIMEYLEDLHSGPSLLPQDPQSRATSRLWADHVNRHIVPVFYKLLQAQDANEQTEHAKDFKAQISKLVDAADGSGPFFLGPHISFVDVQVAPWFLRLKRVLVPYRGWPMPEEGTRLKRWLDALEGEKSVRMTTSTDELYLDSYERYAENRPGTSQLADAVNSGRGLP
ncbi:hypothetical protein ACN47E_010125 [Coniothyrium glycines]